MAKFKFTLIFLFLIISNTSLKAQNWGCYDSLLINLGAYCIPDYNPVCACNGKTYRNECFARNEGYQQYNTGICEYVDFNIKANPVITNLDLDIVVRMDGMVRVYVLDWYGKVYYQNNFEDIIRRQIQIPVGNFDQGVYMVLVQYEDLQVVSKKFVKITL